MSVMSCLTEDFVDTTIVAPANTCDDDLGIVTQSNNVIDHVPLHKQTHCSAEAFIACSI